MSSIRLLDAGLIGLAAFLLYKVLNRKTGLPLPPGPKGAVKPDVSLLSCRCSHANLLYTGWPLIGNALEFPSSKAWTTFAKWGEQWGNASAIRRPL